MSELILENEIKEYKEQVINIFYIFWLFIFIDKFFLQNPKRLGN